MRQAENIRHTGVSLTAMVGIAAAALLIPALSYADPSGTNAGPSNTRVLTPAESYADLSAGLICWPTSPIPPMAGPGVAPDASGKCPPSYALVEMENPTAIDTGNQRGSQGFAPTGSTAASDSGSGRSSGPK